MIEILKKISQKIAEKLFHSYLIATLASTTLFIFMMIVVGWDIDAFINPTILLVLTIFSGSIQRFLGGVGLLLTLILISRLSFKILTNFIKGKKRRIRLVKVVLLILTVGIGGYAIYRIGSALLLTTPVTPLGILFNLYGFWVAIFWVYFLPVIRSEYQPMKKEEGIIDHIKEGFQELNYSLWKGYQKKIKKNYGKVYAVEYERLGEELENIRQQLSGLLLLPFAVILLLFPPLMGITIVLWFRVFSVEKKPFMKGEQILLLIVSGTVLALSFINFFFVNVAMLIFFFDLAYGFGILSGIILLAYLIIKS